MWGGEGEGAIFEPKTIEVFVKIQKKKIWGGGGGGSGVGSGWM